MISTVRLFCLLSLIVALSHSSFAQTEVFENNLHALEEKINSGIKIEESSEFAFFDQQGEKSLLWLSKEILEPKNEENTRLTALSLLKILGKKQNLAQIAPLLLKQNETFRLRQQVLDALISKKVPETLDVIVELLEKEQDQGFLLWSKVASLHPDNNSSFYERLFALFHHSNYKVRQRSLRFFFHLRHPQAYFKIKPLLEDEYPEVRSWAILALSLQGSLAATLPYLEKASKDPSPLVRSKAFVVLSNRRYRKKIPFKRFKNLLKKELLLFDSQENSLEEARKRFDRLKNEYNQSTDMPERFRLERVLEREHNETKYLEKMIAEEKNLIVSALLGTLSFMEEEEKDVLIFLLQQLRHPDAQIKRSTLLVLRARTLEKWQFSPYRREVFLALLQALQKNSSQIMQKQITEVLQKVSAVNISADYSQWKEWWQTQGARTWK